MGSSAKEDTIDKIGEYLFNYAIDREDIKQVISDIPRTAAVNPVTMEYEIQLLKIISAGWGISFFMGSNPKKEELTQIFWNSVHQFSQGISSMTAAQTGNEIDYFNILREHVDIYVKALNAFADVNDPSMVIGPTFAKLCGSEEDRYTIDSGKKIFNQTISGVKKYLASMEMAL